MHVQSYRPRAESEVLHHSTQNFRSWRVRKSCSLFSPAGMRSIGVSINFDMIHGKFLDRENNRLSRTQDGENVHSSKLAETLAPAWEAG